MALLCFLIIFCFLIIGTELKPVDESVTLKLPITIESGMDIIFEGMLYHEHDELSLTFSGDNMNAQDEWHVTYKSETRNFLLIHNGKNDAVLFSPKSYPINFGIQFNARTVEERGVDKHVMELYYVRNKNVREPLGEFIDLPSFKSINHINVKGFSNVHTLTFNFNREEVNVR